QGPGARRADHARTHGAAPALASARRAARRGCAMARAVPCLLGGALRPHGRASAGAEATETMSEPTTREEPLRLGSAISRGFDAPRERVWREWTDPEAFADWFGGRDGVVPLSTVSMDVRPGGSWRMTMLGGPGGREINWHGEYREVIEPERLVLT